MRTAASTTPMKRCRSRNSHQIWLLGPCSNDSVCIPTYEIHFSESFWDVWVLIWEVLVPRLSKNVSGFSSLEQLVLLCSSGNLSKMLCSCETSHSCDVGCKHARRTVRGSNMSKLVCNESHVRPSRTMRYQAESSGTRLQKAP